MRNSASLFRCFMFEDVLRPALLKFRGAITTVSFEMFLMVRQCRLAVSEENIQHMRMYGEFQS